LKAREEQQKLREMLKDKAKEEVRKKRLFQYQLKEHQRLAPLQGLLKVGRFDVRMANSKL
jgi:hypothetical protein